VSLCFGSTALGAAHFESLITFNSLESYDVNSESVRNPLSMTSASNHVADYDANVRTSLMFVDIDGIDVTIKRSGPDPDSGFVTVDNTLYSQLGKNAEGQTLAQRRTLVSQTLSVADQMALFNGTVYENNPDTSGNFVYSDAQLGASGRGSLATFNNNEPEPFIIDFSSGVKTLSFLAGDYGGGADGVTVELFDGAGGTGNSLGMFMLDELLPADPSFAWTEERYSVTSNTAFLSATITVGLGKGLTTNSAFIDNIYFSEDVVNIDSSMAAMLDMPGTTGGDDGPPPIVPEPAAIALLGLGAGTLIQRRRRQRR